MELTSCGVAIIREGNLGGRDDGRLVDSLCRALDTHVDCWISCASLNDRSRGCGDRRNESGEGGQSGE